MDCCRKVFFVLALRSDLGAMMFRFVLLGSLLLIAALDPPGVGAQNFQSMRSEEDWTATAPSSRGNDSLLALKNISLSRGGSVRLSIGGDIRERWEWFQNEAWGEEEQNEKGSLLQRYMLHADLRVGSRLRFFGQLKSGIEAGRRNGPRPVDEDLLDLHQAWAEWKILSRGDREELAIRAGRQEVNLGSGRLVSIREGPNVRLSFDGARLTMTTGTWKIDGLALRPSQTNPGIFDNSPDFRQSLWGVYATRSGGALGLDVYYLGLDRKRREFNAGTGRELRHSFGGRLFGVAGNWDFDYEGVWQLGEFGAGNINAWTTASNTGYTFRHLPLSPRFGFKADVASGDRDPNDDTLGTFNAMFPKGAYFSQADLLGPYNLVDLHPTATFEFAKNFSVTADVDLFWRHSTRDGLYDVPGFLIVPGQGSSARYVGHATNISAEWAVNPYVTFEAEYQRFLPGRFLRDMDRTKTVNYVGVWVSFRF